MKPFRDLAIDAKLTLLVLLAVSVALLLSCIAFVANDVHRIRESMVKQMTTLASVLGSNSTAALRSNDPETAAKLLASLKNHPAIEFACVYDASGHVFATHNQFDPWTKCPPAPTVFGYQHTDKGYLDVMHRIDHEGQSIGTLYLHASMGELQQQMSLYANIVAVVLCVSLGASLILSRRVQRVISQPVLKLAEAAQRISVERDYAIRVTKSANDELGTLYDQFNAMLAQIQQGEAAVRQAHEELELKIEQRTSQLSLANRELNREMAERSRAEQELELLHQELLVSARRAGMAEIATGVLHNVGNVLNSINVSATLASDRMRQSKVAELARATQLIEKHAEDLGTFITLDPKGKKLPHFLGLLATHLVDERTDILKELELLTSMVNHVKTVISTQQSYAGVSGVIETVDVGTLLDDAMKLNSASFDRHQISVVKDCEAIPKVRLDKQKVLQILVNLINNAKDAITDNPNQTDRNLIVRTSVTDHDTLQFCITDNGMGIPSENLTRIFSHGFTTKKAGHGFGLHSCANAAIELGGSLVAASEGLGTGATFILELPFEPAEVPV